MDFLLRKGTELDAKALRMLGVANASETYMALMVRLVPLEVGAAKLLNSLLQDNRLLLERMVGRQIISEFVSLIRAEGPRQTFMRFFATISSSR